MELNKVKGQSFKVKACLKICLLLLPLLNVTICARAQTFDEWFAQGKTQLKYLVLQIEALNAFQHSIRQGYNELRSDWWTIKDWKNGEYTLHSGYYNSLSQVNPVVIAGTDNASLRLEQQSILTQFNALRWLNGLTTGEQNYIAAVRQAVLSDCARSFADLQQVQTPGVLVMSDGERMQRVTRDADEVRDQYEFTCHFYTQVRLLTAQRNTEENEFLNLRPLDENE